MKQVERLQNPEQIKALADKRRRGVFRLLMDEPATLSQLAQALNQSPAWVRHHILALEAAELVELAERRVTGRSVEKYYRAKAGAYLLQEIVLPKSDLPVIVFSGSHDLALEQVGEQLANHLTLLCMPVGSLDGLIYLRQGLCQLSGAHLLDKNGEYNTPFVRHLFPDRSVDMVTLAYRTQGLMLPPGNPQGIRGIADLARGSLRFLNRNRGSGTRLWLDGELERLCIPPAAIHGYQDVVNTHTACARAIASGATDAALGLQAAAHQYQLDFIPLFQERYDLVLPSEQMKAVFPLLDYIQTANFRRGLNALTGYDTFHTGERVALN